jgi:uncharacterized protein (DUF1778 family)
MKINGVQLSVWATEEEAAKIREAAKAERRSVSAWLMVAATRALEEPNTRTAG